MSDAERPAVHLELNFKVGFTGTTDEFHAYGERVMQELLELEEHNPGLTDSTVGTDASTGVITVEVLAAAGTEAEAARAVSSAVQTTREAP